ASPFVKPPSLYGSDGWTDYTGNLYIFGGTKDYISFYNEMFKFTIAPSCGLCIQNIPVANFTSSDTTFCNEGGKCLYFTDHSTGNPTNWKWLFPGAIPDSSLQQNPTNICYANPGTYAVTLIVSNARGTDTLSISPFII